MVIPTQRPLIPVGKLQPGCLVAISTRPLDKDNKWIVERDTIGSHSGCSEACNGGLRIRNVNSPYDTYWAADLVDAVELRHYSMHLLGRVAS